MSGNLVENTVLTVDNKAHFLGRRTKVECIVGQLLNTMLALGKAKRGDQTEMRIYTDERERIERESERDKRYTAMRHGSAQRG